MASARSIVWCLAVCLLFALSCAEHVQAQEPSAEPIAAVPAPPSDEAISVRLRKIYAEIDGLGDVTVEVESGVVTLGGRVLRATSSEQAERLAESVNGVVTVQNEIARDARLLPQVKPLIVKFRAIGESLVVGLPLFALAVAIILVIWWIGGIVARSLTLPKAWTPNHFVDELIRLVFRVLFGLIGLLFAAELLGATALLVSVLGGLGVLGLALSFAVRDTVENFVASILLSLRQPFGANEHVIVDGNEGKVVRLTSRATILMDFDGNHVRIPNSVVYKTTITNYSRNPNRRFSFDVGIDADLEPSVAQNIALSTLAEIDEVLEEPAPMCLVESLGDSNVVLRVFGWVNQREADFGKTRSYAMSLVKQAFEAADIGMPEPIYRLRVENIEGRKTAQAEITEIAEPENAAPPVDTLPDDSLDRQVERHADDGDDLLSKDAARE